ncbi:MAG: hypothetical protein L3J76_05305, partial [Candidatus Hydrothermae bacterium]|nr:hypothetical protein [Candidatus Hydrothermae bacterium]
MEERPELPPLSFQELHGVDSGIVFHTGNILYHARSDIQDILVIQTRDYGRVLVLDRLVMTTERDEFYYHEALVHPVMQHHPAPHRVLILGGGDGGTLREVLRYSEVEQVTVVDQFGRLLSSKSNNELDQTNKEFEYTRKLESSYAERIVQLLQPIVGEGKVNAEVSAALDFALVETTREAYDPGRSVIRSEKINEQETRDLNQAIGIPGALSNQPPGAGTTDPQAVENGDSPVLPANQSRSATRNFEVDRTISHTRNPRGSIERLTVAVVVDSRTVTLDDGSTENQPWSDAQLAQFEQLVKEAIGFKESRGDS